MMRYIKSREAGEVGSVECSDCKCVMDTPSLARRCGIGAKCDCVTHIRQYRQATPDQPRARSLPPFGGTKFGYQSSTDHRFASRERLRRSRTKRGGDDGSKLWHSLDTKPWLVDDGSKNGSLV
jgi:hypothetical protein